MDPHTPEIRAQVLVSDKGGVIKHGRRYWHRESLLTLIPSDRKSLFLCIKVLLEETVSLPENVIDITLSWEDFNTYFIHQIVLNLCGQYLCLIILLADTVSLAKNVIDRESLIG